MPLPPDRIVLQGQTPHRHEIAAFDFARAILPDSEPFRLWAFCDLIDPSGRRYDLDLLILGYHALYLVEMKAFPGRVEGDAVDWRVHFPGGGPPKLYDNPLGTTNYKAKILASMLERRFQRDPAARNSDLRPPWVQPLVFLTHENVENALDAAGKNLVLTRATFARAMTHGDYPGATPQSRSRPVNAPTAAATLRGLAAIGLRPSAASLKVNDLILRDLLDESSYYQDFAADHPTIERLHGRVRTYFVPPDTSTERRDQCFRAARREAQLLAAVADHPRVLRLLHYSDDGPLGGPAIVFERFEGSVPLDTFLRNHPDLTFAERLELIRQIAEALEFCHRKDVHHRALSPRTVLVRRAAPTAEQPGALEVRVFNFQLGTEGDSSGTLHVSSLVHEDSSVYLAPEVIQNPARADARADVFSLGCVAYFILTGRPPAANLPARAALLEAQGGHLSISAARDDLAVFPKAFPADEDAQRLRSLDDVIGLATEVRVAARADSVLTWLNILLEFATAQAPAPVVAYAHPLRAVGGERLDASTEVVKLLGTGSTSRVVQVRRDGELYALKVSLSPELDIRVREEGAVLKAIANSREQGRAFIVAVEATLTLGDRAALLMTDAGESVAAVIAREGPASLDFARRWGDALLAALETLENVGIQHRDIKPANLGVLPSQAKRRRDLQLFDFSLSTAPITAIRAGTPAYRDPFLVNRGQWDHAADRWSAAMTLHEIVTGTRPTWGPNDDPLQATGADTPAPEITLAAERFDASVRDRLYAFFRRALARDVTARFESAEEMRTEWISCFAARPTLAAPPEVASTPALGGPPTAEADEPPTLPASEPSARRARAEAGAAEDDVPLPPAHDLARISPDAPIESLPLGPRARNALDRAGLLTLAELLAAPRNRFLSTRGVGSKVLDHIHSFVDAYQQAAGAHAASKAAEPLWPDYRARPSKVAFIPGLSPAAVSALEDAGLPTTVDLASTPREQVQRVLAASPGALELVVSYLRATSDAAATSAIAAPATIEDWIEALLVEERPARAGKVGRAAKSKASKSSGRSPMAYARMLYGLDPVDDGKPGAAAPLDVPTLARRLDMTPAGVYIALGKCREHWLGHPALTDLHRRVRSALDTLGGVAGVSTLAQALPVELPHRGAVGDGAAASALVRLAVDTASTDAADGQAAGFAHAWIDEALWVATTPPLLDLARRLGREADLLAERQPLPSSDEVAELVRRTAQASDMPSAGSLSVHRLVSIAAEASTRAEVSARLELYPRGLAAERALALAAGALPPVIRTLDDVRRVVRARYPESAPLPDDASLAPMLATVGLVWHAEHGAYVRRGALPESTSMTVLPFRQPTTHTSHRPLASHDPAAIEAAEFERTIRLAIERRHFRVLDVIARHDEAATAELRRRLGLRQVSFEAAVLEHSRRIMEAEGIAQEAVEEADREGPSARDEWSYLRELMRRAAEGALDDIFGARVPVVVTEPGVLARYGLLDVLRELVARAGADDAPAVFLLNPTDEQAAPATIDASPRALPIPVTSPAQRLRVPRGWLENLHRAGVSA